MFGTTQRRRLTTTGVSGLNFAHLLLMLSSLFAIFARRGVACFGSSGFRPHGISSVIHSLENWDGIGVDQSRISHGELSELTPS